MEWPSTRELSTSQGGWSLNDYPFIRQVRSPLSEGQLRPLDPRCEVVQFDEPLREKDYRRLAEFMRGYPHVSLRVYGHHNHRVRGLEFLRHFSFLRDFQVNIWHLESLEDLRLLGPQLEFLAIGGTLSQKPSLSVLGMFPRLKELAIEGHRRDLEAIQRLRHLERLTLRSITIPDLEILTRLKKLWWLALKLGGTRDLRHLPQIGKLKYLELWLVRGLSDLAPVADVVSLQYLFLQALKQVKKLPSCAKLGNLRRVHLETMRGLRNLEPLAEARNLEELVVTDARHMQPVDFSVLRGHSSLRRVGVVLGSKRKNAQVEQMLGLTWPGFFDKHGFAFR